MRRVLMVAGLLLPMAVAGLAEEQKDPGKVAPRAPLVRPGGIPRGVGRGPRITDPSSLASLLFRATPEQRDRALEKVPRLQRERIRRNLEWFDALPKEDQDVVVRRTERFAALSPEKRRAFMAQMQSLNRMPPLRRQAISAALRRLQRLPDDRRAAILDSPEFRGSFTADEQKIISDLSEVMLPAEIHP